MWGRGHGAASRRSLGSAAHSGLLIRCKHTEPPPKTFPNTLSTCGNTGNALRSYDPEYARNTAGAGLLCALARAARRWRPGVAGAAPHGRAGDPRARCRGKGCRPAGSENDYREDFREDARWRVCGLQTITFAVVLDGEDVLT